MAWGFRLLLQMMNPLRESRRRKRFISVIPLKRNLLLLKRLREAPVLSREERTEDVGVR